MSTRTAAGVVRDWWCWQFDETERRTEEMTWIAGCGQGTADGNSWLLSITGQAQTTDDVVIRDTADGLCGCTCPGVPANETVIDFDGHGHRVQIYTGVGNDRIYGGRNSGGIYVQSGSGNDRIMCGPSDDEISAAGGNDAYYDLGGQDIVQMSTGSDCVGEASCAFMSCDMGESAGDNDFTGCPNQCINEESWGNGAQCSTNCPGWLPSPY